MSELLSILRIRDVCARTGLARSTVYSLVSRGAFPSPIRLTDSGKATGWRSDEVDTWLAERTKQSRGAAA